ncbi:MAG: hypothetical protein JSW26_21355 [Desulfobacterales bacterium]|nr:MAG: hypothetical protein JSW26_21355 [Desulfobacterales bacterium]
MSCVVDENRQGQFVSATEEAPKAVEYHYTGKYCTDCHYQEPQEGGNKFLKFNGDFNKLCNCHAPDNYVHPVDIEPSQEIKANIPPALPLQNGKITCLTCHDIYWQCQKRRVDKNSLRGKPSPKRSDFCYKCHDKANYRMLDIHSQLNASGEIIVEKCLYCHSDKPDETRARYENVKFIGDLKLMCQRCHAIRGNHAGNVNHLIKPSAAALARMQAMEKKFGIILPLDENGQLTCITCHNPHDKGVIRAESPAAKGAGSKYRQRLPGSLCIECHQI